MEITTYQSIEEWRAEGHRRFGDNWDNFQFVCPVCGNVAKIGDFQQYAEKGAKPDSATCECIGRYTGAKGTKSKPCDYCAYGLIRLSPVRVMYDGKEIHSFAFADADEAPKTANEYPD